MENHLIDFSNLYTGYQNVNFSCGALLSLLGTQTLVKYNHQMGIEKF